MTTLHGKMRNGTAEAVLLDRQETKLVLHGRKTRGKARRSGPTIIRRNLGEVDVQVVSYGFDGLAPLFDRVANEAHAAKLTSNEDPRNVCLKIRFDMRNVDASPLGAKNKRNCVVGASLAGRRRGRCSGWVR